MFWDGFDNPGAGRARLTVRSRLREMLDDAAGRGLPVRLQVLKANGRAAGFYRRLGFQTMGEDDIHIRIEKLA